MVLENTEWMNSAKVILESIRGFIMKGAEFLSKVVPFEANNIYYFILIVISLVIASKLTNWVPRIRNSWIWWAGLAALIFWLLGYF